MIRFLLGSNRGIEVKWGNCSIDNALSDKKITLGDNSNLDRIGKERFWKRIQVVRDSLGTVVEWSGKMNKEGNLNP